MHFLRLAAAALSLAGCCDAPPSWTDLEPVTVGAGVALPLDLTTYASGNGLTFSAEAEAGIYASLDGEILTLSGEPDFTGYSKVTLTATDACGASATTALTVEVPYSSTDGNTCPYVLTAPSGPSEVFVAGSFNGWYPNKDQLERQADGSFALTLDLLPGGYAYKLVADGVWACDPAASLIACDAGQTWQPECPPNGESCNSLFVVPDCGDPVITVSRVSIDRDTRGIEVEARADRYVEAPWATLDGVDIEGWNDSTFILSRSGLSAGRHTLRFGAKGAVDAYVPFWLDERTWESGLLYFAFVDRFANGDLGNDESEGATVDYYGGDWAGVLEKLDYLDELGVTALWLTAPVDNAEGAWDGQCNATFAGYHGYWPDSDEPEEHFGTEDELIALIEAAHARNMRVLVDWVGNHVHENHDMFEENPQWFNERYICEEDEDGNGVLNWDQRPESCWFASYLPDIDYTQESPLIDRVDAAIEQAKRWNLDGLRIDAVKHMPESVIVNLEHRIDREIQHSDAGGDHDFRTIGETFDGYARIAQYVGPGKLDAQFDFPLYYSIVAAFARDEIGLSDGDNSLRASLATSRTAYGGAVMSTFLGNHDVSRFIAHANSEVSSLGGDGACGDDGSLREPDQSPVDGDAYARLQLAWTFLLTTEGLPLIYYGDEIGLPGYADPDNRQPMRFEEALTDDEAATLAHVQRLGQARRDHPAFSVGTRTEWWDNQADLWAYARVSGSDAVLVALNRSETAQSLTNGLAFAGLPDGGYTDVLTGDTFTSDGDSLTFTVPPRGSRVLVAN